MKGKYSGKLGLLNNIFLELFYCHGYNDIKETEIHNGKPAIKVVNRAFIRKHFINAEEKIRC